MKITEMSVWGDSIAKGVVYDAVTRRYSICRANCCARLTAAGVRVENHSVMGQTTMDALVRMRPENLTPGQVTVIEYAGNDCDLDWNAVSEFPDRKQMGKVPLEAFEGNLLELVARVRAAGAIPVLVAPPPLIAERYFSFVTQGRSAENILRYLGDVEEISRWQAMFVEQVYRAAEAMDTALVDLRSAFLQTSDMESLFCADGIHPNERGHALMYEVARERLQIHD